MKTNKYIRIILPIITLVIVSLSSFATRFSVDVRNYEFSPSNILNVRIGDTIHWEWKDGSHTTTSTSVPSGALTWDTPINSSNMTFDYIPTVPGTYAYKCTPHQSMGMVGSFTVTGPAGIQESSSPFSVSLYPNPFTERITFRVESRDNSRIDQVRVLDVTGKVLWENSFTDGESILVKELSFVGVPAGLLFFEFYENSGKIYVRRVIHE